MADMRPLYVIENWKMVEPDAGHSHLLARGFDVKIVEAWAGEAMPELTGDESGVMVMGGPQMVSEAENWPYMADEFRLVEAAMKREVPLLGICLGSQIIAHVMGARVAYHDKEHMAFGFYDVHATEAGTTLLPETLMVLSGNAQGWDVPHGATLLAKGDADLFPNQAFSAGERTIGLQFHPEVTRAILDQWQTEFGTMIGLPGTQSVAEQDAGFARHDAALKAWYRDFLDGFFRQD